jgi:hypothetical protein
MHECQDGIKERKYKRNQGVDNIDVESTPEKEDDAIGSFGFHEIWSIRSIIPNIIEKHLPSY